MNILGYLQRIGRALMVPVAVLPAAAILMGIGYWIDPTGWGANSPLAMLLIKSGAAIIDNMSWLFAVGVAYGMSKDKDGAAALAGLVGYYVFKTLLDPAVVQGISLLPAATALNEAQAALDAAVKAGASNVAELKVALAAAQDAWKPIAFAFSKVVNQFTGILVGAITASIYNRFSQVELPKALAFFSGKRLVPILTSVAMIVLAFAMMFIWPPIFNALVVFGESIVNMGSVGAGIYGFANRLLIPVGLHHALNAVFWFDLANINDLGNFWNAGPVLDGVKYAAGTGVVTLADDGSILAIEGATKLGLVGEIGRYMGGFFPIMMFGLPAGALAMYHAAKPENREQVGSIMLAAGFASFFTGVTEPLEFSFMFLAPVLYVFHAILTGLSLAFASMMQWTAGFGFSAGLVDFILSSKLPVAHQPYMLLVQGVVFAALYYFGFRALISALNLKTPGREDATADAAPAKQQGSSDTAQLAKQYLKALGGHGNLASIDACITRLRLTLNDRSIVDEAQLKALGAAGVVKLGEQNLQVILGPLAEIVAGQMKQIPASDDLSDVELP
ncbi:PTS system N-acetylglucosamine-specific EIICBA component [Vibrio stylophorae]|uniref:PTS system N-acetylglucosamine-specific EIICBA component n=1 Tax=Vibrio stylophorae TaxID=659351 RepID=A0ABN8DU89_9VIBR|nr:N-acetylglucosamine-specific PTS transporter subunit IIBC [Vibrio stylophorae]CAH0533898.1 PTS system N-acetylglucosamine-specific EIICBA component [Vibrio stylophorae]